ncbi:hypothetical protein [Desertivirga arenae]|uniref:hypothetical protein n=1 Tax=Desertivirga arenae TaxID=2810309 RepID=UPI001A96E8BA|nr:hypothetical protein [Pedobacter sp. SYSU D00823]
MAEDLTNAITFYLSVDDIQRDDLGAIRHWNNLMIGFCESLIWLKGFTSDQVNSVEVKSIPDKKLYYEKGGKLFFKDSLLPERNLPSMLWSPIERGLPVKLPSLNHNYFGLEEKLKISLEPTLIEREAYAMIVPLNILESYLSTAPAIRLSNISWAIIRPNFAFLLGKPLLPLAAKVYWQHQDFIIPAGYELYPPLLSDDLSYILNAKGTNWIIWNEDSSYFVIRKNQLSALSLGSFRRSMKNINETAL